MRRMLTCGMDRAPSGLQVPFFLVEEGCFAFVPNSFLLRDRDTLRQIRVDGAELLAMFDEKTA